MAKRIFFSDAHIGLDQPFSWFDRSSNFTAFLDYLKGDGDINEVIIAGDLMDDWIHPNSSNPPSFGDIINAPENKDIFSAMKDLADNKTVIYISGNHDMTVSANEVAAISPRIVFLDAGIDSPADKNAYASGDILAEHGHSHGMFNGADFRNFPEAIPLPLGYFISRTVASKAGYNGVGDGMDYRQLIRQKHDELFRLDDMESLPRLVFEAVLLNSGLDDTTVYKLPVPANLNYQVDARSVKDKYDYLFRQWYYSPVAIEADAGFLPATALNLSAQHDKKIIIMGHTHEFSRPKKRRREFGDYGEYIYANCGSWSKNNGEKPWTFIETEITDDGHYVRLKRWDGQKPMDLGGDYEACI